MENKKILILSPYFFPHIGGSQRYMEETLVHISKHHQEVKTDVLCYDTTGAPFQETYRELRIFRIPCFNVIPGQFVLPRPLALFKILRDLKHNRYNTVYANTRFFDMSWWGWYFAKKIGARSVLTDHVAGHPVHPNPVIQLLAKLIDLSIVRFVLGKYDAVTVTNTSAKRFLQTTLKIRKPITVSYGGIDTRFFTPGPGTKRQLPKTNRILKNNDTVITYAGRLIRTKGVRQLIKAIGQLHTILKPDVYFVIAGIGEEDTWIRRKIAEKNLGKRIILTGPLNSTEVRKLLQITDIFVHPSYHTEGFPNAVLEAGSSGCFVIATANAGTEEIVTDRSTGFIIRQNDSAAIASAISEAINNPVKRGQMATNLRQHIVNKFDWSIVSEETYKILFDK